MEEVRKFAENTSMKGVPRIMKAKAGQIKTLWIISVLIFLLISIHICVMLILQYLRFDKAIQITDINSFTLDYLDYGTLFSLPAVTVCNQNALTAYNDYEGLNWTQYSRIMDEKYFDDEAIRARFRSPRGYFEHIGQDAVTTNIGKHNFIIDCELGLKLDNTRYPCVYNLTHLPNVLYSQCFTVNLLELDKFSYYATTLSLTLYLDEVNAPMTSSVKGSRASSGAVMLIHGQGQMPDFEDAEFVSPGTLATFKVTMREYHRLPDAKDPCRDTEDAVHIQSLSGARYNYSQLGCFADFMQTLYARECGCLDSSLPVLPGNLSAPDKLRFCANNQTSMTRDLMCIAEVLGNASITTTAAQMCVPPCVEPTHTVTATASPWPAQTSQLAFYTELIHGKSYERHFQRYEAILQEYRATLDRHSALKQLKEETLIQENFAKIQFVLPAIRADLYSSSYQMSLAALVASLGGNLNLWSGISAIIAVEVIDLCVKLIRKSTQMRK